MPFLNRFMLVTMNNDLTPLDLLNVNFWSTSYIISTIHLDSFIGLSHFVRRTDFFLIRSDLPILSLNKKAPWFFFLYIYHQALLTSNI